MFIDLLTTCIRTRKQSKIYSCATTWFVYVEL